MDEAKGWLLDKADVMYRVAHSTAYSFGFLSDGRDHVQLREQQSRVTAAFPDHGDEGWPAFALDLPRDAGFRLGYSSVLTRGALFRFPRRAVDVATDLEALGIDLASTFDGKWCADVGGGAVVTLTRATDEPALLHVEQRRTMDDIARSLRARGGGRSQRRADQGSAQARQSPQP